MHITIHEQVFLWNVESVLPFSCSKHQQTRVFYGSKFHKMKSTPFSTFAIEPMYFVTHHLTKWEWFFHRCCHLNSTSINILPTEHYGFCHCAIVTMNSIDFIAKHYTDCIELSMSLLSRFHLFPSSFSSFFTFSFFPFHSHPFRLYLFQIEKWSALSHSSVRSFIHLFMHALIVCNQLHFGNKHLHNSFYSILENVNQHLRNNTILHFQI